MKRLILLALACLVVSVTDAPAKAVAADEHPRLVFGPGGVAELRRRAERPEGAVIVRRLRDLLAGTPTALDLGYHAAGHAFLWTLTGEAVHADRARALVEDTLADRIPYSHPQDGVFGLWNDDYKLIFRLKPAVGVALAYDLCHPVWPENFRRRVAASLERQAAVLVDTTRGVNLNPWSNWQFSTKAAGGLVALAVLGDAGTEGEAPAIAERALAGVRAHLAELGDRGWTVEGLNYLRYPGSHGAYAFFQAWERVLGDDLASATAARWFMPLYAMHLVPGRDAGSDYAAPFLPFFGLAYVESRTGKEYPLWERSTFRGGDFAAGLGLAKAEWRRALKWTFDGCFGLAGDRSFDVIKPSDAIFALANYPFDVAECNPGDLLPNAWIDERLGYFVFRAEWRDAHDRIAAFTANPRPRPGSYSFQDAGSFRLAGLGGHWAVQRPADRGQRIDREKENAVTIPGTHAWHGGRVTHVSSAEDGSGAVSVDLDDVYRATPEAGSKFEERFLHRRDLGIRARRAFAIDYSGESGAPILCAVVDELSGPGERTWRLHTLEAAERIEGGFRLVAPNGATLVATIVYPENADVTIADGTVSVRGGDSFFVVMTAQHAAAPVVTRSGEGLGATLALGRRTVRYEDGVVTVVTLP